MTLIGNYHTWISFGDYNLTSTGTWNTFIVSFVQGEDDDLDNDGILNVDDACPQGVTNWTSIQQPIGMVMVVKMLQRIAMMIMMA